VDGDGKPELLLAQKNFLRAVCFNPSRAVMIRIAEAGPFSVKEQVNGAGSNSRIVGAAALQRPESKTPSIFLMDAERRALTLLRPRQIRRLEVIRNIPLPFTEFKRPGGPAGGGEAQSIALMGLNAVGILALQGDVWQFTELDGYETPIKDGFLHD